MFCPQCGREYQQKVNFCSHCGAAMLVPRPTHKKLTRSRNDKKIAGVCGGFAEYMDLDATVVRLVWVMMTLFAGWGLVGYLVAWIIMSEAPAHTPITATAHLTAPQPAPNS